MRTPRSLHVDALDALLRQRMAALVKSGDWDLLREVARLAQDDAPLELAMTDPARFRAFRDAVTLFHLGGWTGMTAERVETEKNRRIAAE